MTEFRNEKIKSLVTKPARDDQVHVKVECYPSGDKQWGNRYSNFLNQDIFDGLFENIREGSDVQIAFVERRYQYQGEEKTAKDITGIKLRSIDVNDDMTEKQDDLPMELEPEKTGVKPDGNTLIIRQNCTTKAFAFYGDCIRAGIVQSEEEAIKKGIALGHLIEEDINR